MPISSLTLINAKLKSINPYYVFLAIAILFAIYTTNGKTIALGAIPILFVLFKENESFNYSWKKIGTSALFFIIVFSINLLVVYDFEKGLVYLPHPDFHFYLKVASFFNELGIENYMTSKNYLFNEIHYNTPYRFIDTWLLSMLLKVFPFKDLFVLQCIYIPLIITLVVIAVYEILKDRWNNYIAFIVAILFPFFGSDIIIDFFNGMGSLTTERSLVSYPKLYSYFICFLVVTYQLIIKNDLKKAALVLCLLPILVQVTFPLYIIIYAGIILNLKYFKQHKTYLFAIILSTLYFVCYYIYHSYLASNFVIGSSVNLVDKSYVYLRRIGSISFVLVKEVKFFIALLIMLFVILKTKRTLLVKSYMLIFGVLGSGVIVYAALPNTPNSYQLLTNFIYPILFVNLLIILFCLIESSRIKSILVIVFCCFSLLGGYKDLFHMGFFNTKGTFSSVNDEKFVDQVIVNQGEIQGPIGLTYWSKDLNRDSAEHFDQYGTIFLARLSGAYDVVCLSGYNQPFKRGEKNILYNSSAVNIYNKLNALDRFNYVSFLNSYKFGYLISDLSTEALPEVLKEKVKRTLYDAKSKIYFYIL